MSRREWTSVGEAVDDIRRREPSAGRIACLRDYLDTEFCERKDYLRLGLPLEKRGGLLWMAPIRKKNEAKNLACQSRAVVNEVALSRAMFNERVMPIEGCRTKMRFLAYEAAPLRLRDGEKPVKTSGKAKIDLVGIESGHAVTGSSRPSRAARLHVVEVKRDGNRGNDIPYSLLESYAYAYLLGKAAAKNPRAFEHELITCGQHYQPALRATRYSVRSVRMCFSVCATWPYYQYHLEKRKADEADKARKAARWLVALRESLRGTPGVEFWGFLVVGNSGVHDGLIRHTRLGDKQCPRLCGKVKLRRLASIGELQTANRNR